MKKTPKGRPRQEILRSLQKAVENLQLGITITAPTGEILYANNAQARMHGCRIQDLIGNDARIFVPRELWSNLTWERMVEVKTWRSEGMSIRDDGTVFPVQILSNVITDEDKVPVAIVTVSEDVTERKPARHAFYDDLTNLPNRMLFMDRLNRALKRMKRRQDCNFAVILLNLDRFKIVNSQFGHAFGDRLLIACARRLQKCLRFGDTIARLDSDEFAILLEDIKDIRDATFVAERIQTQLSAPFLMQDRKISTTAGVGIAQSSSGYDRPEVILRDADIAMFRAKSLGRQRYEIFDPLMTSRAAAASSMETALRQALENGEFVAHYQPVISLETGRINGVEALARWDHPDRGMLNPEDFLAVAEETGLVQPIGEYILRAACAQAKTWHEAGYDSLYLSVNLSIRQLQDGDFPSLVRNILQQTGLDPLALQLELREELLIKNAEICARVLPDLKRINVKLSTDDFGTSHCSLGYLKRFSMDILKMDPSFIRDLTVDPKNEEIAATVIAQAHRLHLRVIAEGVEAEEILAFLRWHHCDEIQGNLFSPALPAKKLTELLQQHPALPYLS